MSVPAYKFQNRLTNVVPAYIAPNKEASFAMVRKYQGIASMLIPVAKPDIIFAASKSRSALLFFMC
ncbi:MAG: hypothetical protein BWY67_01607 [Bacteroidetes bacterium ADurb.Bin397]|nr:MAG: hypothetical protein BWY67_01607 [Bacteroidetes bacterium ADurb.Bin397]